MHFSVKWKTLNDEVSFQLKLNLPTRLAFFYIKIYNWKLHDWLTFLMDVLRAEPRNNQLVGCCRNRMSTVLMMKCFWTVFRLDIALVKSKSEKWWKNFCNFNFWSFIILAQWPLWNRHRNSCNENYFQIIHFDAYHIKNWNEFVSPPTSSFDIMHSQGNCACFISKLRNFWSQHATHSKIFLPVSLSRRCYVQFEKPQTNY